MSEQLSQQLYQRFNPQAAGDLAAVFQYRLDEGAEFYLSIAEGACQLDRGCHDNPDATLSLTQATLSALMAGDVEGMQAFMTGQLQVSGDMMLAMRLTELFPTA